MSGVCSSLSSPRDTDPERTVGCAKAPCNSSMEYGGGNRHFVSRHSGLRAIYRSLEHESPETDISRASAKCERDRNIPLLARNNRGQENIKSDSPYLLLLARRAVLNSTVVRRPVTKVIYLACSVA